MNRISSIFCAAAAALFLAATASSVNALSPIREQLLEGQQDVIVILKDQVPNVPPIRRAMGARAAALAASQGSLLSDFPALRGRKMRPFSTINAFAVTVSNAERAQLAGHPMVQAVVPDEIIRLSPRATRTAPISGSQARTPASGPTADVGLCNTLEPQALQLTNTAFTDSTTPQAHEMLDGNGRKIRGRGIKVAFLADALDPNIPGFVHTDGTPVFIDYQDFTGDPAGTPTGAGESFGDASSIAAQDTPNGKPLIFDISKFVNESQPLPSPCDIRVRGMAPDASLVSLVVVPAGTAGAPSSLVIQAVEYAVMHDDVDVISESIGVSVLSDGNDPVLLANKAATQAGVTVVMASGDGGPGTVNAAVADSDVIVVGASTQWRAYAQVGYNHIPLAKNGAFLSNNIAAFSSSGTSLKNAHTVDVVAPGDFGWTLCSTNQALFYDCADYTNAAAPSPLQLFGGTSEAAPIAAGEAAMIIQAYRSTHNGATPSPALVKRIIMGTATDLSAPSVEQGAGLINALAAVQTALSVNDENGHPKPRGQGIIALPVSASVVGESGSEKTYSFSLTNTGAVVQNLVPALQKLGTPFAGATFTLNLNAQSDPTFLNAYGFPDPYTSGTFKVPAGAAHLDAAIAFPTPLGTNNPPNVIFVLIDPWGRQAAFSTPFGVGQAYGHADVVKPAAGVWTAFIWTVPVGAYGSYSGPVHFTWGVERYVSLGSVYPSHLQLAPGASATITTEFSMPSEPGDSAAAIRFDQSPNADNLNFPEIPVTLRTLIPMGPNGGKFTGTLTGANGFAQIGPTQVFAFDVPAGINDMSLILNIADNGYLLEGLLIDPNGMALSFQPNQDPVDGSARYALTLSRYSPQPGRWKFFLIQNFFSSGNQTSLPFNARIDFDSAKIKAPKLPNDASVTLSASANPIIIPVHITNTGALSRLYFADARLSTKVVLQLPQYYPCTAQNLLPGGCGVSYLPTQADAAAFVAQATDPITMIAFAGSGTELNAKKTAAYTLEASINEPEISYGQWVTYPFLKGPFGAAGAPTESFSTSTFVLTQAFDAAMSADSGDAWSDLALNSNTFNPLTLAPGETGIINVTVAPDSTKVGQTVTGFLYIDTFDFNVFNGDEVMRLPYTYTIAP